MTAQDKDDNPTSSTPPVSSSPNAPDELETLAAGSRQTMSSEEQAEYDAMLKQINRQSWGTIPKPLRYTGYLLGVVTMLSLAILLFVQSQNPTYSTWIYGPSALPPGGRASYRIVMIDPETSGFIKGISATIELRGSGQQNQVLFKGNTTHDTLLANFKVPAWKAGKPYTLHFTVKGRKGQEALKKDVTLTPDVDRKVAYAEERKEHKEYWSPKPAPNAPYRVHFFSESRTLISALPNWLYLRVQMRHPAPTQAPGPRSRPSVAPTFRPSSQPSSRATIQAASTKAPVPRKTLAELFKRPSATRAPSKKPVALFDLGNGKQKVKSLLPQDNKPATGVAHAAQPTWRTPDHPVTVDLRQGNGPTQTLKSDRWGFVRIPFIGQFSRVGFQVKLAGKHGQTTITHSMDVRGIQLTATPRQVLALPGNPIQVKLRSLERKGTIQAELRKDGHLVWLQQIELKGGRAQLTLNPPPSIQGIVSLQVFSEFYEPGNVYDTHLLFFGKANASTIRGQLQQHLVKRGQGLRIEDIERFPTYKKGALEAWSRALFATAKARLAPPAVYIDSGPQRLKNLRRYQARFRFGMLSFLGSLGGFVAIAVLAGMIWGYRRDKRLLEQAAAEGLGEISTRGVLFVMITAIILLLIVGVVIYLFWTMQWSFDGM